MTNSCCLFVDMASMNNTKAPFSLSSEPSRLLIMKENRFLEKGGGKMWVAYTQEAKLPFVRKLEINLTREIMKAKKMRNFPSSFDVACFVESLALLSRAGNFKLMKVFMSFFKRNYFSVPT